LDGLNKWVHLGIASRIIQKFFMLFKKILPQPINTSLYAKFNRLFNFPKISKRKMLLKEALQIARKKSLKGKTVILNLFPIFPTKRMVKIIPKKRF
jgi:hypothetical protein